MKTFKTRLINARNYLLLAAFVIASIFTTPGAQQSAAITQPSPDDRIALYQALLDLSNPWTVMCIAAHPDDEDGTSLIVMRRKYGAHTVSLFSTFGEGGQNAIGPELYEELGAIRARETMAAAEIQGSEPHFLGLKDFGYSKSFEETFQKWGHDEALRRMVLEIRKLRPDVIITNHSVTNNDHGHHQATARLVVEAFDAAADPKRFPEQLTNGVTVWQVQRLFVRARGNQNQTGNTPILTIDPNERDPIRGTVYAEEALNALQKHATQGPWPRTFAEFAARFRGAGSQNAAPGQLPVIRYALVKEKDFLSPLPPTARNFLDGISLTGQSAKQLAPPTIDGKPLTEFVDQRGKVLDALIAASQQHVFGEEMRSTKDVFADLRRARMQVRLNKALARAGGVSATLTAGNDVLIPGQSASFELTVTNKGNNPIRVDLIAEGAGANAGGDVLLTAKHHVNSAVPPGETIKIPATYKMPDYSSFTVPHSAHLYEKDFAGMTVIGAVLIELRGISFPLVLKRFLDMVPPVEIASVAPSPAPLSSQKANDGSLRVEHPFEVTVINHQAVPFNGRLAALDSTFGNPINEMAVKLAAGEKQTVRFMVAGSLSAIRNNSVTFLIPDLKGSSSQTTVSLFSTEAQVAPNVRVGYVRGFDYSLPDALTALGVESKELTVDEVRTADLSKYTSVIVDNRVYESQPELIAANQRLLDYANAGGNLIVFYHKSFEWNPDPRRSRPQLAPYKLILGDERITDENAPVTFIEPQHPLLNSPNKIGPDDFKDWIQERGLYYPKEWDPQFHALLQSNDPGEGPLKGGLLVADYGRGRYIYTSIVWYRQLRAGVPGAYRMLANMISYGRASK